MQQIDVAFLKEIEPIMAAVGKTFAEAFASYTVEVLRLSGLPSLAAPESAKQNVTNFSAQANTGLLGLVGEDNWVKEAYLASLNENASKMGLEEARSRVTSDRLIRTIRSKGMTQAALARRIGMKPASLSRVLKHPAKSRTSTLMKIARALQIDVSDILE